MECPGDAKGVVLAFEVEISEENGTVVHDLDLGIAVETNEAVNHDEAVHRGDNVLVLTFLMG